MARYFSLYGSERLHSVVFASAVPPYMLQTGDNPDGPLTKTEAAKMTASLTKDQDRSTRDFVTQFSSAGGDLKVTEDQRQAALSLCHQADKAAALECMAAFGFTDFRDDLGKVDITTLVIHGDGDETVPYEGSGRRTHEAIPYSQLRIIFAVRRGAMSVTPKNGTADWLIFSQPDREEHLVSADGMHHCGPGTEYLKHVRVSRALTTGKP